MRITFVCMPSESSGGQRVIAIHAEGLRRRGHDVVVVSPPRRRPTAREIAHSIRRNWRLPERLGPGFLDNINVDRQILEKYRPVTDADVPDADVVIATWWETAEWVKALSPLKGTKAFFVQHYEVFEYLPVKRIEATWRFPMRKITVAQWLADLARERYGDPTARVVPNAVDQSLFHANPRGKNSVPTVGFMYSPAPFKGCDISLEAFRLAAKQLPDLRLVSFGLDKFTSRLPLPPGIRYHPNPQQNQIRGIYQCCDAWLFGSRSEGFGLPILEAMACRTPVIGTPAGASPELLAGGGGILVRPEDPADMAAGIVRLCNLSDIEWRAMSDAAYNTATKYNWDDATDLFEKALFAAAGRR